MRELTHENIKVPASSPVKGSSTIRIEFSSPARHFNVSGFDKNKCTIKDIRDILRPTWGHILDQAFFLHGGEPLKDRYLISNLKDDSLIIMLNPDVVANTTKFSETEILEKEIDQKISKTKKKIDYNRKETLWLISLKDRIDKQVQVEKNRNT